MLNPIRFEFQTIELGRIRGVYDRIARRLAIRCLPPRLPPGVAEQLLLRQPVLLKRARGGREAFECIGNVQSYLLARHCLPAQAPVPALVYGPLRVNHQALERAYLAEYLWSPVLLFSEPTPVAARVAAFACLKDDPLGRALCAGFSRRAYAAAIGGVGGARRRGGQRA